MLNTRSTWWSVLVVVACSASCLTSCSDTPDPTESDPEGETLQGELKRVVISNPEAGTSRFDYFLELADGRWLPLELLAEPNFEPNSPVLVRGEAAGTRFRATSVEPAAEAPPEVGTQQQQLLAASP